MLCRLTILVESDPCAGHCPPRWFPDSGGVVGGETEAIGGSVCAQVTCEFPLQYLVISAVPQRGRFAQMPLLAPFVMPPPLLKLIPLKLLLPTGEDPRNL